jgi:hypothetical protein
MSYIIHHYWKKAIESRKPVTIKPVLSLHPVRHLDLFSALSNELLYCYGTSAFGIMKKIMGLVGKVFFGRRCL